MYCKKCGSQNDDNARFCTCCGATLPRSGGTAGPTGFGTNNSRGSAGPGPQRPKGSKKRILLIIIIAVAAALAVAVVVAWQKGLFYDSKGDQTQEAVSAEEEEVSEKEEEEEEVDQEELSANPESASDEEYELTFETESLTLTAVGSTEKILFTTNIAEPLEIMWESLDETVATVDENGYVTAVGSGVTVVSASWQYLEAECTVTCEIEDPDIIQITGLSVTATSQLGNQSGKSYKPANLFDGDLSTAYVEGVDGVGSGETIYITLDGEYYIDEILWYPGYQASSSLLSKNGYPTRLTFYFSDGSSAESSVNGTPAVGTCVSVSTGGVLTDSIEVVIESAVAGSKYDDTCISEMEIYGWNCD